MANRTRIPSARVVSSAFASVSDKTPRMLAADVGPVIYAARQPYGIIKIGHSTRIYNRLAALGGLDLLLALKPGTVADEQAIHATLKDHRWQGREFYYPAPAVLAVVNDMRLAMRLDPIAA